jgi:hypothetical protein
VPDPPGWPDGLELHPSDGPARTTATLGAEESWRATREGRAAALLGCLAALSVVIAYGSSGLVGLVISLSAVAALGLVAVVIGVPGAAPRVRPARRLPTFEEPYPSYEQISEQLSWSRVSPRHYDLVTRPLLVRLMSARLADHHGIDLDRDPDAARALVGDDVWWWVDPGRPAQTSSQPPGIDPAVLDRVVTRLERL